MEHVVYVNDKTKELAKLKDDKKSMVIRGATGRKIPHSRVFVGERLYFIEKGSGLITHKAIVKNVANYTKVDLVMAERIIRENQSKLNLTETEIKRWTKRNLCLVEFENFEEIKPIIIERQKNMDDWLIVEQVEDVEKGSGIKYENVKLK